MTTVTDMNADISRPCAQGDFLMWNPGQGHVGFLRRSDVTTLPAPRVDGPSGLAGLLGAVSHGVCCDGWIIRDENYRLRLCSEGGRGSHAPGVGSVSGARSEHAKCS